MQQVVLPAAHICQKKAVKGFVKVKRYVCLGNNVVYITFGTIHGFRYSLGGLEYTHHG